MASGALPNANHRRQVFCVLVEYRLKIYTFIMIEIPKYYQISTTMSSELKITYFYNDDSSIAHSLGRDNGYYKCPIHNKELTHL